MPSNFIQDPTLPQGFSITFRERFWAKVNQNGPIIRADLGPCWEWIARIATSGYGEIQRGRRGQGIINAHVASWMIHNGLVLDGMEVLHHCDFKPCCNPGHLFLGTQADNVTDMMNKGRNNPPSGERNASAKLTWETVSQIRALHATGTVSIASLARIHGMDRGQMCRVIRGHCWNNPPA